jgi:hypothetical protein
LIAPAAAAADDQKGVTAPALVTAGQIAEQRAHAGDCAGALDAFDRALVNARDPDLQRDRGTCHEKLGHPYPAIDDYRAYLTARPNAADADAIRARLESLEQSVGIVKGDPRSSGSTGAALDIEVTSAGEEHVSGSVGKSSGGRSLDAIENDEQLDLQADASPLRRGHGFVAGVVVDPENYGNSAFGWAVVAGIDLRYALAPVHTLLVEVNYEQVNSTGTSTALGGGGLRLGYEARIGLNPRLNDALLVGALAGYEHLSQGSTGFVYSSFEPMVRLGYRHTFGPMFGIEAALDGGAALLHLTGSLATTKVSSVQISGDATTSILGGHVAAVIGF